MKNKRYLSLALSLLGISSLLHSQDCKLDIYKEGQTVTFDIKNYSNPYIYTPEFMNPKPKKKEAAEMERKKSEYLENMAAGSIPPTSRIDFSYKVDETEITEEAQRVLLSCEAYGNTYYSQNLCQNDTMYLTRHVKPIIATDEKGNITSVTIQGVQKIPQKLEVGMTLGTCEDITIGVPVKKHYTVKDEVFDRLQSKSYIKQGIMQDSRDGQYKNGTFQVTETKTIYKSIDVQVQKTTQMNGYAIIGMNSLVTEKTNIDVLGEEYEAYVIYSENWSKNVIDISYKSESAQIENQQKKFQERVEKKANKYIEASGLINEFGYTVIPVRVYFVPGIGVVRIEGYDQWGALASVTTLKSIE